jgi:hypothetical protein
LTHFQWIRQKVQLRKLFKIGDLNTSKGAACRSFVLLSSSPKMQLKGPNEFVEFQQVFVGISHFLMKRLPNKKKSFIDLKSSVWDYTITSESLRCLQWLRVTSIFLSAWSRSRGLKSLRWLGFTPVAQKTPAERLTLVAWDQFSGLGLLQWQGDTLMWGYSGGLGSLRFVCSISSNQSSFITWLSS